MKSLPTKIIVAMLTGVVLVAIALHSFLYWSILQKEMEVSLLAQDIANEAEKVKHLSENKTLFNETSTKRDTLNSYFLGQKDENTVAFLVSLEKLASTNNLTLEIQTPSFTPLLGKTKSTTETKSKDPVVLKNEAIQPSDLSKWEILHLQVRVDGRWADVMQFIALVETMPYQVNFTQANLTVVPDTDLKGKVRRWSGVFSLNVLKNK